MAYRPRYQLIWDGVTFHVTWRCHNYSWLLEPDWTKQLYYDLLLKYKSKFHILFYSYHFMDNHIHLSGKILRKKEDLSNLFQTINSLLAKKINKQLKRRGQVILDRFHSSSIQSDKDLLAVMTYQDLNSWKARKVKHPKHYPWSSYPFYAYGNKDPLLTPAPSYLGLAPTDELRQQFYRSLVSELMQEGNPIRDYSHALFIGDPDWVLQQYLRLQQFYKNKKEAYQKRQRRILYRSKSP